MKPAVTAETKSGRSKAEVSAKHTDFVAPAHTMEAGYGAPTGLPLFLGTKLQPKLTVNSPGDIYEQEADRVAERVMRMPEPRPVGASPPSATTGVQRKCACGGTCAECRRERPDEIHERLQMKPAAPGSAGLTAAPPIVHEVLRSPGQPLGASERAFMEPRFGHDFGDVRVHTGHEATESARSINALGYTAGSHIVFAPGQFSPNTTAGKQLLAHELNHVQQQGAGAKAIQRAPDRDDITTKMPFKFRFYNAWSQAKVASRNKVHQEDEANWGSSIRRGAMHVEHLVPSPEEVWKYGIANGLFTSEEKKRVDEWSEELAHQTFEERYKAAKFGHIYGNARFHGQSGGHQDDDEEIWLRGAAYGLFLPSEKGTVLRISPIGIAMASVLTERIKLVDPKSKEADKLIDDIHDFTRSPAVVLLGPEVEKLLGGPFGYTYRDNVDKDQVADQINKAYYKSLGPGQIRKDRNASTKVRWDECMRRQGLGENNLEAAHFEPICFQSIDEFDREWIRRKNEYSKVLKACGHSRPSHFECRNRVAAEYFPVHQAEYDAGTSWIQHEMEIYQGVVEGGVVSQIGFHTAHDIFGWSSERSAAFGGALSTTAGMVGLRAMHRATFGNPPSGAAQEPTPIGEMVEKPEPMPRPDQPVQLVPEKPPARSATSVSEPSVPSVPQPKSPALSSDKPGQVPAPRAPVRRIVPSPLAKTGPAIPPPVAIDPGAQQRIRTLANEHITVGVQAKITFTGEVELENLGGGAFSELDKARLGGKGRVAQLPEVKQPPRTPGKKGFTQQSAGFIVEPPPGAHELEVLAWNTGEPVKGSNASHAERQVIDWFESRDDKWIARVKKVDVVVFGRDICDLCAGYVRHFKTRHPHIEVNFVRGDSGQRSGNMR